MGEGKDNAARYALGIVVTILVLAIGIAVNRMDDLSDRLSNIERNDGRIEGYLECLAQTWGECVPDESKP